MRRILLSLFAICLFHPLLFAQFTPEDVFGEIAFGISPDSTTGFVSGQVGVEYLQQVNLKIPADAGSIEPMFTGTPVDSIQLVSIDGLPEGLVVQCNSQSSGDCTFLGGTIGCAVVDGIPTEPGVYPITVTVMGYVTTFGQVFNAPYTFHGYEIVIDGQTSLAEFDQFIFKLGQNVPNPATDKTSISYYLPTSTTVDFIVYDLLGREVFAEKLNGTAGKNEFKLNTTSFDQGIYIYSIKSLNELKSKRLIVRK